MKSEILSILALLSKPGKTTSEGKLTWLTVAIIAGSIAAQLLLQANSHEATTSSTTAFLGSALALFMTSRFYTSARTQVKSSLADFLKNPAIATVINQWMEKDANPSITISTSSGNGGAASQEKGAILQRIIEAPAIPLQPRFLATTPEQAADLEKFIPQAKRIPAIPTDAEIDATKIKLHGCSVQVYDPATKESRVETFTDTPDLPAKTSAALFVFASRESGLRAVHI